ncbi:unnamed protein product [Linum tenue]|uniref:Protein kinase domain-containing protein n=1 Tax=Linum tenue TaxID=586396 RepID=A0AAV0N1J6_9ROSI|nr:unnamed protein product [Linum tenue]
MKSNRPILIFLVLHFLIHLTHPLFFNLTDFGSHVNWLAYQGDAEHLATGFQLNKQDKPCSVARATYIEPLYLWDDSTKTVTDFTTRFSITTIGLEGNDYAEGIAFFLAPVGYPIPPNSCEYLALMNSSNLILGNPSPVVMVEFDTHVNDWDPKTEHIGINNSSIRSAATAKWDRDKEIDDEIQVLITYNATIKNLTVFWAYEKRLDFRPDSSLTHHIDLTEVLPQWVTVGFSGSTGQGTEAHFINYWTFNSTLEQRGVISPEPKPTPAPTKKERFRFRKSHFLVSTAVSLCSLLLGGGLSLFLLMKWKTWKKTSGKSATSLNTDLERRALPKKFTYAELSTATNGFADGRRLGEGGSGLVYRGNLSDLDLHVAVKRIHAQSGNSGDLFINEVKIISRVIHRNLVPFIGWCNEQGEFLLVYEYMPNGSLDSHLFGNGRTLQWNLRYNIALGLASALHYLHEEVEKCVLHRDVKPANILLDMDFTAKLGDFGIAKHIDTRFPFLMTNPVGTHGYVAPEYLADGKASKPADVFSFGVVGLELACGQRNYRDGDPLLLVKEVWAHHKNGNVLDAADGKLRMEFDSKEMRCLLNVSLLCTHPTESERPSAAQVIQFLKFEVPMPELPRMMHDPVFLFHLDATERRTK